MFKVEGLYIPNLVVDRLSASVDIDQVLQVIDTTYRYHAICIGSPRTREHVGHELNQLDNPDLGRLILDPQNKWHLERWPIDQLRITRMQPPKSDIFNMDELINKSDHKFLELAKRLKCRPDILEADPGFKKQPGRDLLPILAVRGRIHVHVLDGHHRTTLAALEEKDFMQVLTAYRNGISISRN